MPRPGEPEPTCRLPDVNDPADIARFAATVGAGTGVDRPLDPGGEWWLEWSHDGVTVPLASWLPGSGFRMSGAGDAREVIPCPLAAATVAAATIRESGVRIAGLRGTRRS